MGFKNHQHSLMDFVGTPVSGLPWFLLTLSCLLFEVSFSCEASIGLIIEIKYVFWKFLVASDLKNTCENGGRTIFWGVAAFSINIYICILFSPFFWQKKNGKHQCENGFFYTVFCLLMVLESPKPTKSKTQVSMAHVPTTKSRT